MTPEQQAQEFVDSVQEAVDDWVDEEEIHISRREGQIVADEEVLVGNISIMVSIALEKLQN